jgi:carbamoyltransferase
MTTTNEPAVLGWHASHCSSAALLDAQGRILYAAAEERFKKRKLYKGYPEDAIAEIQDRFAPSVPVVYADLPAGQKLWRNLGLLWRTSAGRLNCEKSLSYLVKTIAERTASGKTSGVVGAAPSSGSGYIGYDKLCDHHLAHAASAYYFSGFEDAAIVTVDGYGDCFSATICEGKNGHIRRKRHFYYNEFPVGADYETLTAMLGFNPDRHCGKITGLAAYGKHDVTCIKALGTFFDKSWQAGHRNWFDRMHGSDEASTIAELRALRESKFGNFSREDLAYAIQHLAEERVLGLIREHLTGIEGKNIALAGGVFSNVRINQKVKELGFKSIFVQPAMDDGGLALGVAAMELAGRAGGLAPHAVPHMFWGSAYEDAAIEEALKRQGVVHERVSDVPSAIAQLVSDGKVVARFDGAMEFGPRALGNRSILYRTTEPEVNNWLNKRLRRTEFMPFAPATLAEEAHRCYLGLDGCEHTAEFMTITFDCTEYMKETSPAVVHVDGTARGQLVRAETNPGFHAILSEYQKLTGIPSLVNTSYNMHESPIVRTPDDAVTAFLQAQLDVLAIGDYLVHGEKNRDRQREAAAAISTI